MPQMKSALLILIALPLCAGMLSENLDEKIATLTNIVLREQITRYTQCGNKIRKLDSFDSLVNVSDGSEQYSEVRRRNTTYSHLSQIEGMWSFGETITMLRTTRDVLSNAAGTSNIVSYRCTAADHRWFVMVGPITYWLDFEGTIEVSPQTGDILRIAWNAISPPGAGIARITWVVDFQSVEIAGHHRTIPATALYRIDRTGNSRKSEWNVTQFSDAGMYGSESTIRFEP
jgi:hypothetical protein